MDFGIAGKRAVVFGGSAGLGFAVCEALAAEGVNLVLFSRDPGRLAASQAELKKRFGVAVDAVSGDITVKKDVVALAGTLQSTGGIDILILNTPRPPSPMRELLAENEDDRWEQAYQHQLNCALMVIREVSPLLLDRGWGRVVAITSASVKQPMARHALSTIFRAGAQAALKHLAMETASRGVTVNAVAPATILTPTFGTYHNVEARVQAVPVKRLGKPEELAAAVVFLASQQAGYITGQVIQVDGGMTLSLV